MPKQPNIIYILPDQHRGQAMRHAGDTNLHTANMDRLAEGGASFTRAYCNHPLCVPSRGTLFTGLHAHANEIPCNGACSGLNPQAPTTAKMLRQAGYRTAYVGRWHLGGQNMRRGKTFNHRDGKPLFGLTWPTPRAFRGGFEDWFGHEACDDPFRMFYYHQDEQEPRLLDGYGNDGLCRLATDYVGSYDRQEPLFMVLATQAPHFPLEVPQEYIDRFDPAKLQVRPNFTDVQPNMDLSLSWREELVRYYAMIENLDENLGELLTAIDDNPRLGLDNTIVVYLSDHGEFGGSHGRMKRKEHPHEESMRIPMIWHAPGLIRPRGVVDNELISMVDMMPTTLGLAGVPVPDWCQGVDFSGYLRGEDFTGPEDVSLQMIVPPRVFVDEYAWRGLVTRRWKYAHYEDGRELLYDLEADPYEMHDMAAEAPQWTERLRKTMLDRMKATGDNYYPLLMAALE